ncbi:hypothetical protein ILUMI_07834 [Ignelater luminosus]|uniref:Aminopeptidase N n=1 Tax=Ignelater luminosus TaxID=2038154 RepID=A0A8K0D2R1_IGNLU|nr:hypothetical protein ILUMI_07834 [Ignelater luminosus]
MIPRSILLVLVSVVALNMVSSEVYRLPNNIKPIRYYLTFEPQLNLTKPYKYIPYYGSVTMELKILENTRNITFNKKRLEIDESSIKVLNKAGKELKVIATSSNAVEEMYTVQMKRELIKNKTYTLEINNFHNNLSHDGLGFFRAYYRLHNEETGEAESRLLAATHFQPAGARIAFPCFDEPAIKAKFIVSLIRKKGFNSVSNEALESTKDLGDGRFKDTFKETPLMSTYILAFAVSDYEFKSLGKFRILAKSSAIKNNETDFALDTSIKTLKALEEYTGVNFVIDKMDQFAVPDSYFRYYAMENWGLVIYGESHLLRSKTHDSADDYQRTTLMISHEFGHQWFGNLVTPAWWDYMWMSESFAAYFQYHTADVVRFEFTVLTLK